MLTNFLTNFMYIVSPVELFENLRFSQYLPVCFPTLVTSWKERRYEFKIDKLTYSNRSVEQLPHQKWSLSVFLILAKASNNEKTIFSLENLMIEYQISGKSVHDFNPTPWWYEGNWSRKHHENGMSLKFSHLYFVTTWNFPWILWIFCVLQQIFKLKFLKELFVFAKIVFFWCQNIYCMLKTLLHIMQQYNAGILFQTF